MKANDFSSLQTFLQQGGSLKMLADINPKDSGYSLSIWHSAHELWRL